jgi:hypothetical protein
MWQSIILKSVNFSVLPSSDCNPNTDNPAHAFFHFPHWWQYISRGQKDFLGHCTPVVGFPDGIWAIALAVSSMLLYLAGLVAVFSIIASGVMYMFAAGNPEKAASARKRLYNSLIGLAIVFAAAPVVAFLGSKLG